MRRALIGPGWPVAAVLCVVLLAGSGSWASPEPPAGVRLAPGVPAGARTAQDFSAALAAPGPPAGPLPENLHQIAPGVCQTMDLRTKDSELRKLRGCRIIEGFLNMVLLEYTNNKTFENISFPELREVTGYVTIYRVNNLRSIGDIFPNLAVIRGMQLFMDFSLIIFDNADLETVGLRKLSVIENGAVRIQNNDRLCYADTIDWNRIVKNGNAGNNVIKFNYDTRLCGLCPNGQNPNEHQCDTDSSGRSLCWDEQHCQKVCDKCGERSCMPDGTCCHEACLGGCSGPSVADCFACRNFSLDYGPNRTCVKTCPSEFYEYLKRCVTETECRNMPPPRQMVKSGNSDPLHIRAYKIFNNTKCVWTCPPGYMEKMDIKGRAMCVPCGGVGCVRECAGGRVDSASAAETFRGCTHIKGLLEISIRASTGNTMTVLENGLGEIREIEGGLKVTRSNSLISLMFLKNLKRIVARDYKDKNSKEKKINEALHVFNNDNLELLWDWEKHKELHIEGPLYIHWNRKLCYGMIEPLKKLIDRNFTDNEVSEDNNGDLGSCYPETLDLRVTQEQKNVVVLKWNKYCVDDIRQLLGYSIYYTMAEQNVTLYGNRDACSDSWSVVDITRDEATNSTQNDDQIVNTTCKHMKAQPLFYPLTQLIPFTRYAAYVKTYTTRQNRKGAQSQIIYFKTLPGRPSPPQNLLVDSLRSHSASIEWAPPALPNATTLRYYVQVHANTYNSDSITWRNDNYCVNTLPSLLAFRGVGDDEHKKEKESETNKTSGDVKNGSCACEKEAKPMTRFTSRLEEERQESILFENALQNAVFQKATKSRQKSTSLSRARRSIDNRLSKIVIIKLGTTPILGKNYTNTTDDKNYVDSLYYELDSNTRSLRLTGLRHFTWYTVSVWACRDRHPKESEEDFNETWCSERSYNTFRTLAVKDADTVSNVRAEVLPSNDSVAQVRVTWHPPPNPNGLVVAYNLKIKLEDGKSVSIPTCLPAVECREWCEHRVPLPQSGNYSVQVTPVTVSGAGNSSALIFVHVQRTDSGLEWVWGLVGGCMIIILILGGGIWYARRGLMTPAEANKLFASVNPEYVSTVYVPDEWEVPRANIEFIRELGQGSFGMVYEGIAKNIEKGKPETRCAVKTVNEHATDRERIEFLNEASVMKAFDTHHVVRLLGVVSRGQPTLVIMELMELGDLKSYLRSHRPDPDGSLPKKNNGPPPTLQNILQMAIEIADGMAYLSAKKFVHRDLAARNCMVAGDLTVKVGDFGMTRDIYETDYYRKGTKGLLPVRWMSPESLKDGVFSSSSDVWSYGVVLWEMATLAMQPYQGLSNEQVVRYVREGGVMERPEQCPDRLYELMRACWQHRPSARPTFLRLVADLAPTAHSQFRHRSFFHSPLGQEIYALQRTAMEDEQEAAEVNVGAVATGSGSNLFGVSGRLASWVRELSSLRSRGEDDAAAEPLQPPAPAPAPAVRPLPLKAPPNGTLPSPPPPHTTPC